MSEWLNATRLGRLATACCCALVNLLALAVLSLIGDDGALFWVDVVMRAVSSVAAVGVMGYLLAALLGPSFYMDSQE